MSGPACVCAHGAWLSQVNVFSRHEIVRADLGMWSVVDADGNRLRIPPSVQIDPGGELGVYSSCRKNTNDAIFVCLDSEVLDDDGDVLVLLDAGGREFARFAYGTAAE